MLNILLYTIAETMMSRYCLL